MPRMTNCRALAFGVALSLARLAFAAAPALAGDYCIKGTGAVSVVYVGKGFSAPGPGKCGAWQGFCVSGCSPDNVQKGVACTASDNSHVSFGLTTYYLRGSRQFDWIRLDLPSKTGSGNLNTQDQNQGTTDYTASGAPCPTQKVP